MMTRAKSEAPGGRRGVTLQEVLGALFLAEVGLLSLLTLFPPAMAIMAQAMRDCRDPKLTQLADDILYVRDDIVATSEVAFDDLTLGDPSRATIHYKRFAIHDEQLTALIEVLKNMQPMLQDKHDRYVAQQSLQIISEWRIVVRELMYGFHVLAQADRQFRK